MLDIVKFLCGYEGLGYFINAVTFAVICFGIAGACRK